MDGFSDLAFFSLIARRGSLAAAAREIGLTPPAVSKRLALLERRLGVRLLNRTTRRLSLTPEGETYLADGERVLEDLAALERRVAGSRASPQGLLQITATFGFGRRHIAPALAEFVHLHPAVEARLRLSDQPVDIVRDAVDVDIRFGDLPDVRLTARRLALNRRILCATPGYLKRAGTPGQPADLVRHRCLFIREADETFGSWHFALGGRRESVKVSGPLASNDGEAVLGWALAGQGIALRSQWEAGPWLRSGRLRELLPQWRAPAADIHAVFATRSHLSAKTRAFVDFLVERFAPYRETRDGPAGCW